MRGKAQGKTANEIAGDSKGGAAASDDCHSDFNPAVSHEDAGDREFLADDYDPDSQGLRDKDFQENVNYRLQAILTATK